MLLPFDLEISFGLKDSIKITSNYSSYSSNLIKSKKLLPDSRMCADCVPTSPAPILIMQHRFSESIFYWKESLFLITDIMLYDTNGINFSNSYRVSLEQCKQAPVRTSDPD
ncbi:hypothetical protein BpHYR1_045311 [Brachionus plicatilis]|uniref:Uncharacterized protein n=1 Tax=Brachionus plicatilis TaxID=10195 RepID=A0A3M7SS86_BRAPC|nr:hypothetical protein BpHYR1_045311 [Brachionus plicatilis]